MKILTFIHYYLPSYKSGGPVRSVANMVTHLGGEFDFKIITLDREMLETRPYQGVSIDSWNSLGESEVYYASPETLGLKELAQLMNATPHDVVYLNSFFDLKFTIYPLLARRLGMLKNRNFVLAPRGEFSKGAIKIKGLKKKLFLLAGKILGLWKNLTWQASSEFEAEDIRRVIGGEARNIRVAVDLPPNSMNKNEVEKLLSNSRPEHDQLKVIFISRISPKKNLDMALRILGQVQTNIEFNVVGPIEEQSYWELCQSLIQSLPQNIKVNYRGTIPAEQVTDMMARHDLMFLPTHGENYGHVIHEALCAGTPVLISDTTPWRNLEQKGIGWDLPLGNDQAYVEKIDWLARKNTGERLHLRKHVIEQSAQLINLDQIIKNNRDLFIAAQKRQY